jgi:hypothetical protein
MCIREIKKIKKPPSGKKLLGFLSTTAAKK